MPSSVEDVTKRYLEVFKQVTQIDTASILVALGIQGVVQLNAWWIVPPVASFVVSLLFALGGLVLCVKQENTENGEPAIWPIFFDIALWVSMVTLVFGPLIAVVILLLANVL